MRTTFGGVADAYPASFVRPPHPVAGIRRSPQCLHPALRLVRTMPNKVVLRAPAVMSWYHGHQANLVSTQEMRRL